MKRLRWKALIVALTVIGTMVVSVSARASEFVALADQHYVDECRGAYWPGRNTFETQVTSAGYVIGWKFKLSQSEVDALMCLKARYGADFVEVDFRTFGFIGQDNWDAYWVTGTNLPSAVHDVAAEDTAPNMSPGVTSVNVARLEAEKDYYVGIAWNNGTGISPDISQTQRVSFEWLPSRWASSVPEQYVCGSHWQSVQDDGWCIFGITRVYVSHGYRDNVSVPFSGQQSHTYPLPPAPRPTPQPAPTASVSGPPLYLIKTRTTTSGRVEVHSALPSLGYGDGVHAVTRFGTNEQNNGWFQMVGNDLCYIKTKTTASGRVEIHCASQASGYQTIQSFTTRFGIGEQDNGWFQLVGDTLFFIKTKNVSSGRVEVHSATRASSYQSGASNATWLPAGDHSNGWFQMLGPDLFFVKTKNTGSGRVEVHTAWASSGYRAGDHWVTRFGIGEQDNGWFQIIHRDLWFIKTRNTGSGRVEIHSATQVSGYTSGQGNATWLSPLDQSNGWFQVGLK